MPRLAFLACLAIVCVVAVVVDPGDAITSGPSGADLVAACASGSPYFVTASLNGLRSDASINVFDRDAPVLLLFSDTPQNRPQYTLATLEEVGAVFGLAYRRTDQSVYAAAYHKVQLPFGPGGPGAIYRVDLDSGAVSLAINVPNAGIDHHEARLLNDRVAETWTSRTSLGDIDLSDDESELFAVNLADRQIYRFAVPSGALLGSFAHGAVGEPWAESARPFGLAWHDGYLYHGIVNSAEKSGRRDDLRAVVYRSHRDGSGMAKVADLGLGYRRGRVLWPGGSYGPGAALEWKPWRDGHMPSAWYDRYSVYPMALLTDLTFDDQGNMVIGLRDRRSDCSPLFRSDFGMAPSAQMVVGLGVGDILHAVRAGSVWQVDTGTEHYSDGVARFGDESALGGLAALPGLGMTAAGAYVTEGDDMRHGAFWFGNADGNRRSAEQVGDQGKTEPYRAKVEIVAKAYADDEGPRNWIVRGPGTVGDVEELCAPEAGPTASPSPSATTSPTSTNAPTPSASPSLALPTPTPTDTGTATATSTSAPSPTTTPSPGPMYLPIALRERCLVGRWRADVVLVFDTSSSMQGPKLAEAKVAALAFVALMQLALDGDQVAIVRFDGTASVAQALSRDREVIEAAIRALDTREGTHIDEGLAVALAELRSDRHDPESHSAIVLLTDGIHNGVPGADQRVATDVRESGIHLYVIGLGDDVDAAALLRMAGDPARYFFAPGSSGLAGIYGEIAGAIQCPPERFWGRATPARIFRSPQDPFSPTGR